MADPLTIAAIGWGISAAGWLISPVLTNFINKCLVSLHKEDESETYLHLVTALLPDLTTIMRVAHEHPDREILQKWLEDLREAFCEAQDILDMVEYESRELEVKPDPSCSHFLLALKPPCFSPQKKKLLESLQKIKNLFNEAHIDVAPRFRELLNSNRSNVATMSSTQHYREITSNRNEPVFGRDGDRDLIVNRLRMPDPCSDNSNIFSVIGVYGVGGLGKTTLAQYVCEYEKDSEPRHFNPVMWVHVSREFDADTILKKIWESAFPSAGKKCPSFNNRDVLQNQLKGHLKGKKFLLVLDDVWCNDVIGVGELNQIFASLKSGTRGSKVLVTTRMENAAKALGDSKPIKIRELDYEQFLKLFMHYAIDNANIADNNLKKELIAIGREIAKKMYKSPLVARTVAGQLSIKLDSTIWLSMLSQNLLRSCMGALFLSYEHLELPLRRCFVFCSLFPKGYSFTHDELLEYWIAEQFIESEDNTHVKDVAYRYIYELASSSFFQHEKRNGHEYYSVHDLLHDLAENVTKNVYFRIESAEGQKIPTQVQHLFVGVVMQREHIKKICKLKSLRTIIILEEQIGLKYNYLDDLFMNLKKLRVVCLGDTIGFNSEAFSPKYVAHLKHLRYLRAFNTEVKSYKQSNSKKEKESYKQFNGLYHMCFLHINKSVCEIPNFGRLKSIQNIPYFEVKKNKGFELNQLKNLREIHGSLEISNLTTVTSKEEALTAELSNKVGIKILKYNWLSGESEGHRRNEDKEIFEGLRPPPNITSIAIVGYLGGEYPSWISEINLNANHLQDFELRECYYVEELPESLQLLTLFQSLSINNVPSLKRWQQLPATLARLHICGCFSLIFITCEELDVVLSSRVTQIKEVVRLLGSFGSDMWTHCNWQLEVVEKMSSEAINIDNPNDLENLMLMRLDLISKLRNENNKLNLPENTDQLEIKSCALTNTILWKELQGVASLTSLILRDIITITSIPKRVLANLNNLLSLRIDNCLLLTSLGGLETLRSLEELIIQCCPILILGQSTQLSSSLKRLSLKFWKPPNDICKGLDSLEMLRVDNCPSIVSPHLDCSKSLEDAKFFNCSNLNSIRGLSRLEKCSYLYVTGSPDLKWQPTDDRLRMSVQLDIDNLSMAQQLLSRDAVASVELHLIGLQDDQFESSEHVEVFQYLSSLRKVHFTDCIMHALPTTLAGLTSLIELHITSCENLSGLPDLPASLEQIHIHRCNSMFMASCKENGHSNCLKLSGIRYKSIY